MEMYAAKSTYVVFSMMVGIPFLLFLAALLIRGPFPGCIVLMLLFILAEIFICFYISRFKIKITTDSILYRTMFLGTKEIKISNIDAVRYRIGADTYKERFLPLCRLEIRDKSRTMIINIKFLSKGNVNILNSFLKSRSLL
ncbi:hypothetical protein [Escherichia whittamii]|uniref:hypothetical protein n=1 Tax=Escherichia whittamii TaxID=2762229 RepID=UPI002DBD4102|nr:hypothetical protein [Escherichia whittamii]MEB7938296.1 hypothetical protein [Escherichia whittamii]